MEEEKAIKQMQENLAMSQEMAHIGSWSYDISHDQTLWSDELCRIFDIAPGTFLTKQEEQAFTILTIMKGVLKLLKKSEPAKK